MCFHIFRSVLIRFDAFSYFPMRFDAFLCVFIFFHSRRFGFTVWGPRLGFFVYMCNSRAIWPCRRHNHARLSFLSAQECSAQECSAMDEWDFSGPFPSSSPEAAGTEEEALSKRQKKLASKREMKAELDNNVWPSDAAPPLPLTHTHTHTYTHTYIHAHTHTHTHAHAHLPTYLPTCLLTYIPTYLPT